MRHRKTTSRANAQRNEPPPSRRAGPAREDLLAARLRSYELAALEQLRGAGGDPMTGRRADRAGEIWKERKENK